MAHRRTSSLVLPLSVPPAASLPPVAISSSSSATSTSPTRSTTTTTTMRTITAVLSRSPSPLPSPVTMSTSSSRERTFSDELENARMHADAPLPDLASFGFDFLAPPSMSMSPPLTPGTPSKLDPGFKPTYGHHGHASSARRPPSSSPVSIVVASIRTTLRRLAFLASSYSAGSSSSSLGGGLPLKSPRSSRGSSITIPLPLRRRATALALLALLVLCAYTVFLPSSSTQVGRVGKGGVRQRVWAADKEVRLDELDPEERRRLLSTAASYRGGAAYGGNVSGAPQQRVKKTRPTKKTKPKAKHPLASNGNGNGKDSEETLTLTPADELAALTSFLLNAGSAALDEPQQQRDSGAGKTTAKVDDDDDLDPKRPLDPSRVLAFDVARMGAEAARVELEELKRETWAVNPVVVFGKSRHAPTRELRGLLDGMRLQPAPTLFEIDTRVDESILSPLLARLVAATTPRSVRDEFFAERNLDSDADADAELELELELPLLLVGGEPVPLRTLMPSFHLDSITYRDDDASPDASPDSDANANANRKSKDTARLAALEALGRKLRAAGAVPQPPKRRKGGK